MTNQQTDVLLLWLLMLILLGIVFFLPSILAFRRQHPNRWVIFVLNLFTAPTAGITWLVGIVWALNKVHVSTAGSSGGESGLNVFVNDEKVRIVGKESGK
jgi:hypothetical protein